MKSSVCMPSLPCALHLHSCPWPCSLPGTDPPELHPRKIPQTLLALEAPGQLTNQCCYISSCLPGEPVLYMDRETPSSLNLEKAMSFCTVASPASRRSWRDPPVSGQTQPKSKGNAWPVAPCPPAPRDRLCSPPKPSRGFLTCTAAHTHNPFWALRVSRAGGEGRGEEEGVLKT